MATSVRKYRKEITLTKSDRLFIRKHICKEGESIKEACERIIQHEIERTQKRIRSFI